jgi:hypothetical protein
MIRRVNLSIDDKDPVAFEQEGFAAEQINAPQAVFAMTECC